MLMPLEVERIRREIQLTILHRPSGDWTSSESGRIVNGLMTEMEQHPQYPEYAILFGHYSKQDVLQALSGGVSFTALQVTGVEDERLPWRTRFCI